MTAVFESRAEIEAALATDNLDPDVREHLQGRLRVIKAGRDPFERLPQPPSEEPW